MGDRYINSRKLLMFEITSTELKTKEDTKTTYTEITSSIPDYINSSIVPMFELKSYHEGTPELKNLLDFVEITGGTF